MVAEVGRRGGRQSWTSEVVIGVVHRGGRWSWLLKVVLEVGRWRWSPDLSNEASVVMKAECTNGEYDIKCQCHTKVASQLTSLVHISTHLITSNTLNEILC